ncbi:MAG: division/cell wall cluster transcriptional repressor MraZ [Sphingobacterium sp.]
MIQLIGEFECKLDTKGRLVVPAALKRQLPDVEREGLVVNRGFEKNLVIYTKDEWNQKMVQLKKLNPYSAKSRNFVRQFMRGATELNLDSAGRVLLPKSLLEYAGIQGEVFLQCQFDKIELWAKAEYEKLMNDGSDEGFASLAEEVMGGFDFGGPDDEQ